MPLAREQYAIRDTALVVAEGEAGRRYVLRLRDLPCEEKPREKLFASGVAALSTAELLAVLLGVGTKREDALAMANRIFKEYGSQGVVTEKNPRKLATDLAIPEGKAARIVAALELGRRLFERNTSGTPILRTAKEVFEYVKNMRDLPKEHLRGLYLNTHYKLIHDETISIGTVDANIIHPREVFKPALEYSAAAVILVHNHPSGVLEPSDADRLITSQLVRAGKLFGIDLIDHVIVTRDEFMSVPADYAE